jgi:hypothetical protein
MNAMQLSVALLPAVEPDEVLVYLEHIRKQCERVVELIDELETTEPGAPPDVERPGVPGAMLDPSYNPQTPPPRGA